MDAILSAVQCGNDIIDFDATPPEQVDGTRTWYARLQHTLVAWSDASDAAVLQQDCGHETLLVLPMSGAVIAARGVSVSAPGRSVCVLPVGPCRVELPSGGTAIRLFSPVPDDLAAKASNQARYVEPRAQVRPLDQPYLRQGPPEIRVYPIGPADPQRRGRPPAFQSQTMNVLWLEQFGPQDRAKLAPHAHEDFEEGALVLAGDYLQHLRTPWTADAQHWQEDQHCPCHMRCLTIIPPTVVHVAEAVGTGQHIMLNIFAPARADHIESGMVLNAAEYRPPT